MEASLAAAAVVILSEAKNLGRCRCSDSSLRPPPRSERQDGLHL